jgi:hypothetical protein
VKIQFIKRVNDHHKNVTRWLLSHKWNLESSAWTPFWQHSIACYVPELHDRNPTESNLSLGSLREHLKAKDLDMFHARLSYGILLDKHI